MFHALLETFGEGPNKNDELKLHNRSQKFTSVSKDKVYGTVVALPRSGRKIKLSPAAERKLVRMVKSQPKSTNKQVCNELEAAGGQVSVSMVRCVLRQHELSGCCAREKPLI